MDKRRYQQVARAASADETRRRILDAARVSLERGPLGALKVEEVARAAGVSRSTVYLLFGSRAGLFGALAYQLKADAGFGRLIEANKLPDALAALRGAQRASVRMYGSRPELARALFTLAAIDPDAVSAVAALEDGRRPGMRRLARRLSRQGYLRSGISIQEAADLLTVATSFDAFDQLHRGSGLPLDVVADRLVALAERSVCRPDVPSSPEGAPAG
jgi:AcrR family transcriptional regulator